MTEKRGMKALELWCRRVTEGYPGVKVENMTTSWRDGLAFCALIHHFRPDLIDFDRLDKRDIYKNNELAFRIAERQLGIPALLDAEDMVQYEVPDRLSILTYLSQFYQTFVSNQHGTTGPSPRTHSAKVSEIISPSTVKSQKAAKVGPGRLELCCSCRRPVFLAERLVANGKLRHRTCFTCKRCGNQLNLVEYYETEDGEFVCETCPDEEKRDLVSPSDLSKGEGKDQVTQKEDTKDEYSCNFELALEAIPPIRRDDMKMKFLNELVDGNSKCEEFTDDKARVREMTWSDRGDDDNPGKNVASNSEGNRPSGNTEIQHFTADKEILKVKVKKLLGKDFSDTLSLLNKESDSFIADVSEIIDNIINDAVKEVEKREEDLSNKTIAKESEDIKLNWVKPASDVNSVAVRDAVAKDKEKGCLTKEEVPAKAEREKDYPEDLNPFAGDDEDEEIEDKAVVRERPVPAVRTKITRIPVFNEAGQKIIEAPLNLNPFWSDGEPSSDEDVTKPVPAPRSTQKTLDSPFLRGEYGSLTSLTSIESSASAMRRKKGPAPPPPSGTRSLQYPSKPSNYEAVSPTPTIRSHRKSKPAPPPPVNLDTHPFEKKEKNYENKVKQNLSVPDKSSYGKWKRKKGQAPALPIPQRRRITPLPLPEFYRELEDLEIQQRELERQGVTIEQTIRKHEEESMEEEGAAEGGEAGKDIEGLILQLFEIVNQKNELFRRQAELMYLRRQQRLEEEHADIEYQIRCLMGRPERNKTDSDKAQEEELIRRLVEVVERRNEIIECLDMDRKREVEEDESIHHHLEAFAGKKDKSDVKPTQKGSPSLLKYIKKKKAKKEKMKESSPKHRRDVDKDVDEINKEDDPKTLKIKKKWFVKP